MVATVTLVFGVMIALPGLAVGYQGFRPMALLGSAGAVLLCAEALACAKATRLKAALHVPRSRSRPRFRRSTRGFVPGQAQGLLPLPAGP